MSKTLTIKKDFSSLKDIRVFTSSKEKNDVDIMKLLSNFMINYKKTHKTLTRVVEDKISEFVKNNNGFVELLETCTKDLENAQNALIGNRAIFYLDDDFLKILDENLGNAKGKKLVNKKLEYYDTGIKLSESLECLRNRITNIDVISGVLQIYLRRNELIDGKKVSLDEKLQKILDVSISKLEEEDQNKRKNQFDPSNFSITKIPALLNEYVISIDAIKNPEDRVKMMQLFKDSEENIKEEIEIVNTTLEYYKKNK